MKNIDYNFTIRYEKAQAEDLKKRAIALKDLGFHNQAKLLLRAARHSEAKALILLRVENLRKQARLGRMMRQQKESDSRE
jgi:hypothetical protein